MSLPASFLQHPFRYLEALYSSGGLGRGDGATVMAGFTGFDSKSLVSESGNINVVVLLKTKNDTLVLCSRLITRTWSMTFSRRRKCQLWPCGRDTVYICRRGVPCPDYSYLPLPWKIVAARSSDTMVTTYNRKTAIQVTTGPWESHLSPNFIRVCIHMTVF
jgi:hypothetical protein